MRPGYDSMASKAVPPGSQMQPEMPEQESQGIAGKIVDALEQGIAGLEDPVEIASILRELADRVEAMGGAGPSAAPTPDAGTMEG